MTHGSLNWLVRGIKSMAILFLFASVSSAQTIRLKSVEIDPDKMAPAQIGKVQALAAGERRVVLVQWDTPIDQAKLDGLVAAGAELIQPLPDYGYMVSLPASLQLSSISKQAAPKWASVMDASWKLHPEVSRRLAVSSGATLNALTTDSAKLDSRRYRVQLVRTGGESSLAQYLGKRGLPGKKTADMDSLENWLVSADDAAVRAISQMNSVIWIEPFREPQLMSEREALAIAGKFNADRSGVVAAGAYQPWLASTGLSGANVIVHVMDDGLSKGIYSNKAGTAHPDILGRIVGIDNATGDGNGESGGGHGHLNASIIMGQPIASGGMVDKNGYKLGQGVAPNAYVYATKIFTNFLRWDTGSKTESQLVGNASIAGATISSNSWGANVDGEYDMESQLYDRLTRDANIFKTGMQPMTFVFSAGNSGPIRQTIGSPGTGKNIITVGANENNDAGVTDGSGMTSAYSNDMRDVAVFSSRGPMADGRLGPTVVANGTHVPSGASDSPNFNGLGVSGRDYSSLESGEPIANSRYYPAFQHYYTWSSGTSHSCPLVAGAAVLLYEYFLKKTATAPSPALIKAALIAGAADPVGGYNNRDGGRIGTVPNNEVGWGFATLKGIVDNSTELLIRDQATVLTASGQQFTQDIQVTDSSKPLRIVLAWTDVPAFSALSKALVNDLDLTVSDGEVTYYGNVFANGQSVEGGSADRLNNVECVFITNPAPSIYTITVKAHSITGDARPGVGGTLEQDFALIATNGSVQSSIGRVSFNKTAYNCGDSPMVAVNDLDLTGKGKVTVTVTSQSTGDSEQMILNEVKAPSGILRGSIGINTGTATKNNGVLSVRDGDTITATYNDADGGDGKPRVSKATAKLDCSAPTMKAITYGKMTDEAAEISIQAYESAQVTITYGPAGQETLYHKSSAAFDFTQTFSLLNLKPATPYFFKIQLTDKAGNTRQVSDGGNYFGFQTLTRSPFFQDDMESGGSKWTHSAAIGGDDWRIVFSPVDTMNHTWFVSDPDYLKDAFLFTPSLTLPAGADLRLEFWHTYEFERAGATQGWDGGVLEVSRDGGQTWLDMGSYMLEGGYNATISSYYGCPIAGRRAWSGGKVDDATRVLVDLTPFAGQTVKLRWRIGCDIYGAGVGWYIDDVSMYTLVDGTTALAKIKFDDEYFTCANDKIPFTIRDLQFSTSSDGLTPSDFYLAIPGQVSAFSISPSTLNLTPASESHDVWQGWLTTSSSSESAHRKINGVLDVGEGETLQLIYKDAKTGTTSVKTDDTVKLDCTAPKLVSFTNTHLADTEAIYRLEASEPVLITVAYGASPTTLNMQFKTNTYVTSQEVILDHLNACLPYYYTIKLVDKAGNTTMIDNFGDGYGLRTLQQNVTLDTLDPQPQAGWTHSAGAGTDDWKYTIGTTSWNYTYRGYVRSGSNAWGSASTTGIKDDYLVMPPMTITPIMRLTFWHTYEFENGFDGARIEVSTDGGTTWQDLGASIITGRYNGTINSDYDSPIANQSAWTGGKMGPMTEVQVDLKKYAGTNRRIRFRHACDRTNAGKGWMIDDISLLSYVTCGTQFPGAVTLASPANNTTGFAYSGGTLTWTAATGATKYEVFLGKSSASMQPIMQVTGTSATIANLKAGTRYYWAVHALNSVGAGSPSATYTFKTTTVDPTKIAKSIIGSGTLSAAEKAAVDYNDDGKVLVNELVTDINGK